MILLALLLALAGIGVLAYPTFSNYVNQLDGSYAIQQHHSSVLQADTAELAHQQQLATDYNSILMNTDFADLFSDKAAVPAGYEEILDFGGGMMGYLEIPKIQVRLPILHGVSEDVLNKTVGHLPQSSFPIGRTGCHAVLTGHTGLPSAALFTDLIQLEPGDCFSVYILGQVLTYQVDQILTVLPNELQALAIDPGKDLCTLVTCTPYGINSHRLLVRGQRVENSIASTELLTQSPTSPAMPPLLILLLAAAAVLVVGILFFIIKK